MALKRKKTKRGNAPRPPARRRAGRWCSHCGGVHHSGFSCSPGASSTEGRRMGGESGGEDGCGFSQQLLQLRREDEAAATYRGGESGVPAAAGRGCASCSYRERRWQGEVTGRSAAWLLHAAAGRVQPREGRSCGKKRKEKTMPTGSLKSWAVVLPLWWCAPQWVLLLVGCLLDGGPMYGRGKRWRRWLRVFSAAAAAASRG